MAYDKPYEPKEGDFVVFINKNKTKETQPDITIKLTMNGNTSSIPLWKKDFGYTGTIKELLESQPQQQGGFEQAQKVVDSMQERMSPTEYDQGLPGDAPF
jgi:hypothetical protein